MINERKCGVLAHPTSFPSKYGIGDLGSGCMDFIDFLVKAKQKLWQVLPLGHTSYGDSPYQSFSTFAGNPLLISLDILKEKELLEEFDFENMPNFDNNKVEYGEVIQFKNVILKKAFLNFKKLKSTKLKTEYKKFCSENSQWLDDYALFISLKNYYIEKRRNEFESAELKKYIKQNSKTLEENAIYDCYYGASWNSWDDDIASYEEEAVEKWQKLLKTEIEFYKFCQFEFFSQWDAVKAYAEKNDIQIIGDIPIFVAYDSADVWSNRKLFCINSKGYPTEVAGVPPDYFSETGQLWGNPLYNWKIHKSDNYEWWIKRVESLLKLVHIIRIDHFRAFESYWSIPYGEKTAIKGKWKKGPNKEFFEVLLNKMGNLPIIAEDLGDLNEEVHVLRKHFDFPGMKILQFAFSDTPKNLYLPHNYTDSNCVVYTGTHDNDTTAGWYASMDEKTRDAFRTYQRISGNDASWDMIRLAISSVASICLIPIQDLMNLGSDARMNKPGIESGNWQFRYAEYMLTDNIAKGIAYLCEMYNR